MAYKTKVKKQDGGFYFADYDIHAIAKTQKEAIGLLKETHGVDVEAEPETPDPKFVMSEEGKSIEELEAKTKAE